MAYLTPSDLLTRFGAEELAQIADRATPRLVTADLIKEAIAGADLSDYTEAEFQAVGEAMGVINGAIEDACSLIDGYLAGNYDTPLADPPRSVVRMAGDIARYYLHDDHATETVQKRYDAAIALFRDVSTGKVSLDLGETDSVSASSSVEIVTAGRVFGRSVRGL